MIAEKRIVIHIGIHKTGSTSIQNFLWEHRAVLRELSVDFYFGAYNPRNHVELHAATMRADRSSPFKLARALQVDEAFRNRIRERVK